MVITRVARATAMAASDSRRIAARTPWKIFAFSVMLAVVVSACGSTAVPATARHTIGEGALESLRGVAAPPDWTHVRTRVGAATLAARRRGTGCRAIQDR